MTIDPISVRFYVHADTPVPDRRRRVTRQLTELATNGAIDSYSFDLWPRAVSLDALGEGSNEVLATYEKIQLWADRAGASVRPPFSIVADQWEMTGVSDTRLHTPNMCLLVERGDELVVVFPHERDDGVWTLQEGLAALETESGVEIEFAASSPEADESRSGVLKAEARAPEETNEPGDTPLDTIER